MRQVTSPRSDSHSRVSAEAVEGATSLRRSRLAMALLGMAGVLALSIAANDSAAAPQAVQMQVEAHALDQAAESRIEGDEAMDGAIAASLIGAISGQFGERDVGVKLDEVAVKPASLRDRAISGHGRLRIGDGSQWIPFQFDAQYDTVTAAVTYPELVIGGTQTADSVALDSDLARGLNTRINQAMHAEFAQQPVQVALERVTAVAAGERYLQVSADGVADFAREGKTDTQVTGLYDPGTGEWIRLDYELGTTANWAETESGERSVATR